MYRVTYRHWKTGMVLTVEGTMPEQFNNPTSDRIVVLTEDGIYEDVIRNTIIEIKKNLKKVRFVTNYRLTGASIREIITP